MTPESFLENRPRLLSIAHRILGTVQDAEDAVQTAWLRVQARSVADVDDPAAWLTTVVTRVCVDQIRERRRREAPGPAGRVAEVETVDAAADEAFLRREDVSRALMVLLTTLTPPQRVAYVLHDLFAVPFGEIAEVLDTTVDGAKKHASRARRRLQPATPPAAPPRDARHEEVVTAFLGAAADGNTTALLSLLAPDCVRTADASLLPAGAAATVSGASAVAEETRHFVARIRTATPMQVNGRAAYVLAPGGRPWAVLDIDTRGGVVTRITVSAVSADDRYETPAGQGFGKWDL
ncbi:RNA polymerase sigma-70 factor (ECF subfamily) [Mycolicibacterium iranicum]|uniref:RNA polymerase sigma-70 factor (ECF subfamily) n=1 Tax=Mycolicibacterium iranicum TaxID=912594 RepID=A0A839QCX9_MYCIR|nr:sigma-70 family RNA polymerase sigma factor [Mycolicibacterium iranicum]MBB2991122.1 RNA polymerase sigma-70 factor (ECF subfamily) [Mycolicibacterium iranicum]